MRAALAAALLLISAASTGTVAQPARQGAIRLLDSPAQGALVRGMAPAGTISLSLDGRPVRLAPNGAFLIGFDRDAGPGAILAARLTDGRTLTLPLAVPRQPWSIQHINMARPTGGPTPEYARLREGELARLGAARAMDSDSNGWAQVFIWPAQGRLSGRFGAQRVYRGGVPAAPHSGTDIAAGAGAIVVAPADGVVVLAPPPVFSLEGNLVIVDHGMGLSSAFLHLSQTSVRIGDRVRQGQEIGRVGMTGRATGPHLHWSVVWNGVKVDPQTVVHTAR
jgi:murein DD-endopeptidase MepM/ murein hydrolase activator NlpD